MHNNATIDDVIYPDAPYTSMHNRKLLKLSNIFQTTPYTAEPLPDMVIRFNPIFSKCRSASAIPG